VSREAELHVRLLRHTPEPERAVATAARLCYSPAGVEEIDQRMDDAQVEKLVGKLVDLGHESPFEHASFTFGVEGVSRALTHQLVRHRIASYSQQSQRYVDASGDNGFRYIVPPSVREDAQAYKRFTSVMERLAGAYGRLGADVAREDARYVLPNAAETKIVITMNARELWHFLEVRCCERAQWEIRAMATEMLRILIGRFPLLFAHAGPGCVRGPCSEGTMSCGKAKEIKERFARMREDAAPGDE